MILELFCTYRRIHFTSESTNSGDICPSICHIPHISLLLSSAMFLLN